jgi:predicted ATP-dependent endonuclease of OLD family
MDEPEISLHIEWQYRLFEEIQKLNPHCQIITSTHSPSLFGDGWGDKLVFIEDLLIH